MKKKLLPVLTVIVLIFLVLAAGLVTALIRRYTPSKEKVDGRTYFQLAAADEAALVINRMQMEEKVKIIDGRYYLDRAVVEKYINSRFYWDEKQRKMLYTMPTEEFQIVPDMQEYQSSQGNQTVGYVILKSQGDAFYLDLEFIGSYTDMEYTVYTDPERVVVRTDWEDTQMVTAIDEGKLRQKGGIKSPIVDEVEKDELLYLEEELENWSRVSTQDGYTGYIEKEKLSQPELRSWEHLDASPQYTSLRKEYKINMAWHQVTSQEGNEALEHILENTQGLNTISPTWFSVTSNDGTVSSLASADYVNQAHERGLEVWGLIDNFNSEVDTLTILSDTQIRAHMIQQLMEQAQLVGLDGINLDFESITEEQAPHYVQFIRELSIACRLNGLVFSIDDPVPMPYTQHYNRKEQGVVADYVIVMGYDEHHSSDTEAGSVASLEFVKNGILDSLKEVPPEKLINAIPFYTRVWIESFGSGGLTNEALGMEAAASYIAEKGMDVYWNETVGQNIATVEAEDAIYTIWVEDEQSIGEKMKLIQENQLAGVAEWKLGLERPSVWPVIEQYLQ